MSTFLIKPNSADFGLLVSHAALPVVDRWSDGCRVYFSSRVRGRAQIGFFETDTDFGKVKQVGKSPVITVGQLGTFDDNGVTASWIVHVGLRTYRYYSGWTLGSTVPFYIFVDLAVSEDHGKTYRRVSSAPILEGNKIDPYLTASPCLLIEDDKMENVVRVRHWLGYPRWSSLHHYHIKYAESSDGFHWKRDWGSSVSIINRLRSMRSHDRA